MRLIEIYDCLSMSKERKKRTSWLLIASTSLLSIQQTNIRIGKHLLEQERYRDFAPLYLIRQKIAKAIDMHTRPSACFRRMLPSIQHSFNVITSQNLCRRRLSHSVLYAIYLFLFAKRELIRKSPSLTNPPGAAKTFSGQRNLPILVRSPAASYNLRRFRARWRRKILNNEFSVLAVAPAALR